MLAGFLTPQTTKSSHTPPAPNCFFFMVFTKVMRLQNRPYYELTSERKPTLVELFNLKKNSEILCLPSVKYAIRVFYPSIFYQRFTL